ncbi:hypothetical protein WMO40_23210 [Bacillaceae bacterium CLA-AA-H227]|uniref:Uncharacterized protein n=1 Tax=Robertmurraya yapensis (ex Hitch et al 2024) TaxID=3133160 RepID=A0ACC6SHR9_9BACI
MPYHIMLTKKVFDIKGQSQIQVQVMDTAAPQIIYFTLDELEKDELTEELKEYIRVFCLKLRQVGGVMDGKNESNKRIQTFTESFFHCYFLLSEETTIRSVIGLSVTINDLWYRGYFSTIS